MRRLLICFCLHIQRRRKQPLAGVAGRGSHALPVSGVVSTALVSSLKRMPCTLPHRELFQIGITKFAILPSGIERDGALFRRRWRGVRGG
ncbi:hypothetical protein [Cupriavidus campinensis]